MLTTSVTLNVAENTWIAYNLDMLVRRLPLSLQRRNDVDAVFADIAPYEGTTVEDRVRIMIDLCRYAAEQVSVRPDGQRILDFQDPRSPESLALWCRLVAASDVADG